jgi:S1-C subfamily serine protease
MYTAEALNCLFVSGVIPNAPAEIAGVKVGDLITGLQNEPILSLSDMYRKLWSLGDAGVTVMLNLNRDGEDVDISVKSDSRYNMISKRQNH